MPLIKSAIKRMRQNARRNTRLNPYKTRLKTVMKKIEDLAKEGKIADATKALPEAFKAIDFAAKKKLIHPKNAGHKKSKLSKLVSTKK